MSHRYIVIVLLLAIILPIGYANADIGIDISNKCKTMIKNNLDTTCPTIQQILALFPDTSPSHQVGDFEVIDGMLLRGEPQYNIENMRKFVRALGDDNRIWINPPGGARSNLQMIIIESNFEDYPIKGSYKMENNTISMGTQRYVNFGCTEALINSDDWIFLTGDTIIHMQNDCTPESTNFDHIKKFYFEKSFQDIRTSYKYILEKWIEESKIKCLTICKEY